MINDFIFSYHFNQGQPQQQPGGDGKLKMDLNLKELAGDPSDTQIGAAAVGLMADAVNIELREYFNGEKLF